MVARLEARGVPGFGAQGSNEVYDDEPEPCTIESNCAESL